jgi:nucleotide-binding universal stress UspA family protein
MQLPNERWPRCPRGQLVKESKLARRFLMFNKILHANDGSEHAFHALSLALSVAKQNQADLHMVCVKEIPNVAGELAGEASETAETEAHRFYDVIQRARAMAEESQVPLHAHIMAGRPARDIAALAAGFNADLLVIGAKGHSALYERMIGSRANRIMQLAPCPVLVAK